MAEIGKNLPAYYKKSRYVKALNTPVNAEFERLYELIELFMKNRFIDSADENSIREYEKSLGISEIGNTLEARKSLIKIRMRGSQTSTKANLQSIVRAYDGKAIVSTDNPNYRIIIQIFKPLLLQEILKSVNEVIPAHIAITCDVNESQSQEHKNNVACICAVSKNYETVGFDNNVADDRIVNCAEFEKNAVIDGGSGERVQMANYRTFDELQQIDYEAARSKTYAELLYKEG